MTPKERELDQRQAVLIGELTEENAALRAVIAELAGYFNRQVVFECERCHEKVLGPTKDEYVRSITPPAPAPVPPPECPPTPPVR